MLRIMSFVLIAVTGSAMIVSGAYADVAPSCPGGGTATGTFHCTGVINPVCSEGAPWTCSIKSSVSNGLMEMGDDNVGGGHPHHGVGGITLHNAVRSFR